MKMNEVENFQQKIQKSVNSKTMTDSANVYKRCFMQICFMFSADKKYLRLVPLRGRKLV